MKVIEQTRKEIKFPHMAASIVPMVWAKAGIGQCDFVITYSVDDLP